MASKGKVSTIRVAVCGLISSSYNGLSGQGAGKSFLCNRFIQTTHDKLSSNHNSVLNLSEFGSNVINNTHFLYWGEKVTALEDGQEIRFQIVEHSEFVDDSSLKPFSTTKPYHKRCMQIKLQSGGKVAYISPEQLAFPEDYADVPKFPDKFSVDGFILCVDVSTDYSHPSDAQREFFDRLLQHLISTKKPVVVACTKFDRAKQPSIVAVQDVLSHSKRQVPMVEVSAVKGVNVDTCFLVLAHLIDTKKPKTRIISYKEAKEQLDERVRRNEEALQCVLDERLTDFSMPLAEASRALRPIIEYQVLVDLSGQDRVNKLIQAKLNYLKLQLVKSKISHYLGLLPDVLTAMLPVLDLRATADSAKALLRASNKFDKYFVDIRNWKENTDFLKSSPENLLPFEVLLEEQAQTILENHINEVLAELRSKAAAEKVKQVLHRTTDILPGVDMMMLWVELGLSEEVKRVSKEVQVQIYNEYMGKLEQECVADLTELFLERSDLFDQLSSSPEDAFGRIHQELKDVPRYKRLDHRSQLRQSQALKHIGSLQMPGKARVYGKSGLQDVIEELEAARMLNRDKLKPGGEKGGGACWDMDPDLDQIRLSILARTEANAKTLRSDFMNHLSGSGEVKIGERVYQLELSLQHGHHIHSLNTNGFTPHGAVAVVTTLDGVKWLRDLVERLWMFEVGEQNSRTPPYRGLPLIILALDKEAATDGSSSKIVSEIHNRAQAMAGEVQGVCISETPTPQPMRLVVSTVINQILLSLINAFSHLDSFFNQPLLNNQPTGFNVAVCTLVGDPYPNEALLNPLLQHQLVCCNKGDHSLFVKCAIEKQHRTCVLTFNSMFNVPSLLASIHLGFILVYSTQRPASLSVLKYLLPKLPAIPKLIVAMTTSKSHDRKWLAEGQELANKWETMFVCNHGRELPTNFAVEFLHKAWYRRFSSWQAQNLSDNARQRGTKQTRALPDRPSFNPQAPLPQPQPGAPITPSRHSTGNILDHIDRSDPPPPPPSASVSTSTLPRSPVKPPTARTDLIPKSNGTPSGKYVPLASTQGGGAAVPPSDVYDTVDEREGPMYATIDVVKPKNRQHVPPPQPPVRTIPDRAPSPAPVPHQRATPTTVSIEDAMYSAVSKPSTKVSHQRIKSADFGLRHDPAPPPPQDVEQMYSVVQKPRTHPKPKRSVTPEERMHSVPDKRKQPPPVAPKPVSRSPTPNTMEGNLSVGGGERKGSLLVPTQRQDRDRYTHMRSESFDTGLLPYNSQSSPSAVRPDLRSARSQSMNQPKPPRSPLAAQRSPSPEIKTFSSLPNSYRNRAKIRGESDMQRARSKEELPTRQNVAHGSPHMAHQGGALRDYRGSPRVSRDHGTSPRLGNSPRGSFDQGASPQLPHWQLRGHRVEDESYRDDQSDPEWDEDAPPLPSRNYSWSDIEDNDEDILQSDDDLDDEPVSRMTTEEHQKLYSSIRRLSTSVNTIEDIYNVVNRIYTPSKMGVQQREIMPPESGGRSDWLPRVTEEVEEVPEQLYDTLENVVASMQQPEPAAAVAIPAPPFTAQPQEGGTANAVPAPSSTKPPAPESLPLTPRDIKLIKQQQKLLQKLQRKLDKEAEQRRRQEEKKRKREEAELRRKAGKKGGKKEKHQKPAERARYFGSPLATVIENDGIPSFVHKCVEVIEAGGMKGEGLYRISGKKEDCLTLQDRYDQDCLLDITSLGFYESCISSTLKQYFKLLPEPLIPIEIANQLLVTISLDTDSQRTRIQEILSGMPRANLCTLRFMMQHLYNVQLQQDANKMNASNLAIVFWPTLIRPPLMDLADSGKQMGWQLVMTNIIEHPDYVPGYSGELV